MLTFNNHVCVLVTIETADKLVLRFENNGYCILTSNRASPFFPVSKSAWPTRFTLIWGLCAPCCWGMKKHRFVQTGLNLTVKLVSYGEDLGSTKSRLLAAGRSRRCHPRSGEAKRLAASETRGRATPTSAPDCFFEFRTHHLIPILWFSFLLIC